MNDDHTIWWRFGEELPTTKLALTHGIVRDTLIPRPLAWISVHDNDNNNHNEKYPATVQCCLLDGYTAACYTPPILFFAASVLPPSVAKSLQKTRRCTLSAVTIRDPTIAIHTASTEKSQAFTFSELGLQPVDTKESIPGYPSAVATSPLHMYCSLTRTVEFDDGKNKDDANDFVILLTVEKFVMDTSILSSPPHESSSNSEGRTILAKIDASRIGPIVGLGGGRTYPISIYRSMPRPLRHDGNWTSTDFERPVIRADPPADLSSLASLSINNRHTIEWNFRTDGRACILGYNPTTALIAPRPIGWISTYSRNGRIAHLAPYSFFIDVHGGGDGMDEKATPPMVAFSAFVKQDGGDGSRRKKDAHKDAEEMGCFCFNMPTRDLAVPLNYSAAELKREESEFELAGLAYEPARYVDAPIVRDAPVHYECEYVQTIDDVGGFSIVIGKVIAVSVHEKVLTDGQIDVDKLHPIMRLGYTDEYCVL
jgi:flavin reductase (DIM6/NTAB) family NADH-FMN oxidoreductase RutF